MIIVCQILTKKRCYGGALKGCGTFFDELCLLMIGFDRGQPPAPGRQASRHTPRVNSKASELTFPCCESRGGALPRQKSK